MLHDAYVAGLLDGEGQISIIHRSRRGERGKRGEMQSYIFVALTMTDKRPLQAISKRFGSAVYEIKSKDPRWKDAYRWQVAGPIAEEILRAARPYLLLKARHADLCLEFRKDRMMGGRASPERARYNAQVMAHRLKLREEIRFLNKRGPRTECQPTIPSSKG